ncbi:MAG: hypothetical protein MJY62_03540 [Bacteroidales bacterium]|nr:hypothetical protein [Bacteroidales bacterium]
MADKDGNIGGKGWRGFRRADLASGVVAVVIAVVAWLAVNLSQTVHEYDAIPVRVHCDALDGFAASSTNAPRIGARCSASGFQMMRVRRSSRGKPVDLPISSGNIHFKSGNTWYMTPRDFADYVDEIFGSATTVNMFLFDTVYYTFANENCRKVPVKVYFDVQCSPQYTVVQPVRVRPDSIMVYGDPAHLENIEAVTTLPVRGTDVSSSIHGEVRLATSSFLRYSTEMVAYDADVVRYVEVSRSFPIELRGVPRYKTCFTLPSSVTLSLRCRFPVTSDPFDGVSCHVDYSDYLSSLNGDCPVKVEGLGDWTLSYELDRDFSEVIVMEKR